MSPHDEIDDAPVLSRHTLPASTPHPTSLVSSPDSADSRSLDQLSDDEKKRKDSWHSSDNDLESVDNISIEKLLYEPIDGYEGKHRYDPQATWTEDEEKKVIRKIDLRIMTFACLIFFCLQLDRVNISSALSDNMLTDLKLTTQDYNNGMSIFYACFLFAELPSQLISKRLGPDRWVPIQIVLWSIVTISQSAIKGRSTFFATRALLGLTEGGLIPDIVLFLSYFYKTAELPIRLSFFWVTMTLTTVIQSFLAYGILRLGSPTGWEGWRYLFAIEGALTASIGIFAGFYLPPSPTQTAGRFRGKAGWFTEREETIMVNRVLRDDPSKGQMHNREGLTFKNFKECLCDYDNWPLYLIGLTSYQPFAPPSQYLTLTLRSLGFNTFDTNLLVIPSSVLWMINCFGVTFLSRKLKEKTFTSMIAQIWGLPLLIALITLPDGGREWIRFALISLLIAYPYAHPILVGWNSSNSNSVRLRTVSSSLYNMSVQMGSIISTQIYRTPDKPYYHKGNKILLGLLVYNIALFCSVKLYFISRNRWKRNQWKKLTVDEKEAYLRDVAPKVGNKSLVFMFEH